MSRKFPRFYPQNHKPEREKLSRLDKPFRIAFEVKLDNGFELKDMTMKHLAEFHRFLADTVYKGLTIAEVDRLFLRKEGLSNAPAVTSNSMELVHYGKASNSFRIFGYYNFDDYFVICRIDGSHQTHR